MERTLLLCAANSPALLGIYEGDCLVHHFCDNSKTDVALVNLFQNVFNEQRCYKGIDRIILARGPGRHTSLKLSYIFAKTLSVVYSIPMFGIECFELNANQPIFAFGHSYFVKKGSQIQLAHNQQAGVFVLPQSLNGLELTNDCTPLYVLGPIG